MVSVEPSHFLCFTASNHLCYLSSSENFKWSHQSHLCPSTFWEEFMLLSIWPSSFSYLFTIALFCTRDLLLDFIQAVCPSGKTKLTPEICTALNSDSFLIIKISTTKNKWVIKVFSDPHSGRGWVDGWWSVGEQVDQQLWAAHTLTDGRSSYSLQLLGQSHIFSHI